MIQSGEVGDPPVLHYKLVQEQEYRHQIAHFTFKWYIPSLYSSVYLCSHLEVKLPSGFLNLLSGDGTGLSHSTRLLFRVNSATDLHSDYRFSRTQNSNLELYSTHTGGP